MKVDWYNTKKAWHKNIGYILLRVLALPFAVLGFVWLLSGVGTIATQILGYLKNGHWEHKPLLDFFNAFNGFISWIMDPQSWIGLSHILRFILEWTPYSIGVFLLGLSCAVLFAIMDANIHGAQFKEQGPNRVAGIDDKG